MSIRSVRFKYSEKAFKGIGFMTGSYLYKFIVVITILLLHELFSDLVSKNMPVLRYAIAGVALYYLLKALIYERSKYIKGMPIRYLIYFFLAWILVIVIFGVEASLSDKGNYINFKMLVSGRLLLLLIPFILLIDFSIDTIKRLFRLANVFANIYLIGFLLIIVFPGKIKPEYWVMSVGSCASIIALTTRYHSTKISIKSVAVFVIGLIVMGYLARRNAAIYCIGVLIFSILIYIADRGIGIKYKSMNLMIISVLLTVVFLFATTILDYTFFIERLNDGFHSRDSVVECFYDDFDLNGGWIMGRGMFGMVDAGPLGKRTSIESGYLNYILIGGYIYLLLFVTLSLVSIYFLLFKSNNILCKCFCAILVINLIDLIGFGLPALTMKYIYVWVAMTAGFLPHIRLLTDNQVRNAISLQ
jgi:hypothetical protein